MLVTQTNSFTTQLMQMCLRFLYTNTILVGCLCMQVRFLPDTSKIRYSCRMYMLILLQTPIVALLCKRKAISIKNCIFLEHCS